MEESSHFLSREKLLGLHRHKHFPLAVFILAVFLLLDLVFLNYKILGKNKNPQTNNNSSNIVSNNTDTLSKTASSASAIGDTCGQACQDQINKAVAAALSTQNTQSAAQSISQSSTNEYFIPLGTSVVNSTSWQTVSGLQASIDGSAYGSIQTATFEISVSIPTGNETANFLLYNSTQNHPVWNSNVTFSGGTTPQLLISSPITLDPGSNLYVVQAQTQLTFPAYITQARVRIITY